MRFFTDSLRGESFKFSELYHSMSHVIISKFLQKSPTNNYTDFFFSKNPQEVFLKITLWKSTRIPGLGTKGR